MELITIKESHFAADLSILKSRLESEGIECFIEGELTSQVLAHIPSMQAKLKIHQSDFEKVKAILIENGVLEIKNYTIICPKCSSEKCSPKKSLKEKWRIIVSVFITLVTFVPVGSSYRAKTFVCNNCRNEFSI